MLLKGEACFNVPLQLVLFPVAQGCVDRDRLAALRPELVIRGSLAKGPAQHFTTRRCEPVARHTQEGESSKMTVHVLMPLSLGLASPWADWVAKMFGELLAARGSRIPKIPLAAQWLERWSHEL